MPLRRSLVLLALAGALLLAACDGGSAGSNAVSTDTAAPPADTPTSAGPDLTVFHEWLYPIQGACLPHSDRLMPNAPREYRGGTHEGVDFYDSDNCTKIERGTQVLAAKDGTVIRTDHDYSDLTQAELDAANERIAAGEADAFEVIDLFRGRQVWIDHGGGIITRYAHLGGIAEGIVEGRQVAQGEVIAFVGDSGTPESISNPDQEIHLHWELRIGESYLGAGLPPEEVRAIYEGLFEPVPDNASFG